ncbi:tyrosine-protein kinase HTK16 isoform X2 [Nematostella vectensis]|uniref:tyrosine-protein kinase HTK16 isoform X2 n=1 Tax=Nematostella vectensis TaxID=45351 RepID=UPI00138FBCF6|nr:tyrosine-protein kinase HTK16 isoform X2 [Nematostella vectensis]
MSLHNEHAWFHGEMSREAAVDILVKHGKKEGLFLVRESKTIPGDYVLSLWTTNQALHFQIQCRGDIYFCIDDGPIFHGLDSLVDYYRENADGLPIRLTQFCPGIPPPSSTCKHGYQTPLHQACRDGNINLVQKLLRENPLDVNARNEFGATPLHEATSSGFDDVVQLLLQYNADPRSRDNNGFTGLICACIRDHPSTCQILVTVGKADVQDRCPNTGWVALHEAAARGYTDCFQALVEMGAPLHPRTTEGDTPRDLALRYGHVHIADMIDNYPMAPPKTSSKLWLHGHLDRKGAVNMIKKWGTPDGAFLVRQSTRDHGYYVLSLAINQQIYHFQIQSRSDRWFYIDDGPLFETLPHVIDHYSKSADGLPVLLQFAVPPDGRTPIAIAHYTPPQPVRRQLSSPGQSVNAIQTPPRKPVNLTRSGSSEELLEKSTTSHKTSSPTRMFKRATSERNPQQRKLPPEPEDYNKLEEWTGDKPHPPSVKPSVPIPPPTKPPPRVASRRPPPPLPPPDSSEAQAQQPPLSPPDLSKSGSLPATHTLINREALELGSELGQGEFGSVLRGVWRDPKGKKVQVALKTLHPEKIVHGEQEFLREARVMYGLDHPCIVRLIGVCLGPPLILVQELVTMGALLDFLIDHQPEISPRELKLWAAQIAWGMMYLEKKRFVHRDLATRNILMASKQQLKISDFGLSRAVGSGSDYYKASQGGRWPVKWYAPESINYGTFSHKSDVWSYGVTLWEMYSFGQLPYGEMTGGEVIKMLENEGKRLDRPDACPEYVYKLMLKCWDLSPENRPTFNELHNIFSTDPLYADVRIQNTKFTL